MAVFLLIVSTGCGPARPEGSATPQSDRVAVTDGAAATLRVVVWNIRHGQGTDHRVDLPRIAEVLHRLDPDIVTLQEVDDRTERTGGVDQPAELARLLSAMGQEVWRSSHGPHRAYQGGWYGNAVLTRLPVVDVRTHPIPPAGQSALAVHEVRVAVGAGGEPVSVVSIHLAGSAEERAAQAATLTRLFGNADHPVVLTGDFNGRPDDPAVAALAAAWRVLPKAGDPGTYPAGAPDREIDFVMVGKGNAVEAAEHRVVAEPVASDHRPLLAVLRMGGGR